jgi:hypothetical protein
MGGIEGGTRRKRKALALAIGVTSVASLTARAIASDDAERHVAELAIGERTIVLTYAVAPARGVLLESDASRRAFAERVAREASDGLVITMDGARTPVRAAPETAAGVEGAAMRVSLPVPSGREGEATHTLTFDDASLLRRPGALDLAIDERPGARVTASWAGPLAGGRQMSFAFETETSDPRERIITVRFSTLGLAPSAETRGAAASGSYPKSAPWAMGGAALLTALSLGALVAWRRARALRA